MRFHKEITFPAAPDAVFAMLAETAFRERVAQEAGATTYTVEIEETDTGLRSVLDTSQPSDGLPAIARKFIGREFSLRQEEVWHSPTAGTLTVSLHGTPGSILGTVSLAPAGAGTIQTVESDIKIAIPRSAARSSRSSARRWVGCSRSSNGSGPTG